MDTHSLVPSLQKSRPARWDRSCYNAELGVCVPMCVWVYVSCMCLCVLHVCVLMPRVCVCMCVCDQQGHLCLPTQPGQQKAI